MRKKWMVILTVIILAMGIVYPYQSYEQQVYTPSEITRIAFLGTGTPNPDPDHSGISVAIIVNNRPYIVDFGPGLIRKAAALSPEYGGKIKGLSAAKLNRAFLTHLHADHTMGYPDLILTPWILERNEPLEVYGPEGLDAMTRHILEAYKEDIKIRLYGLEPANNQGWRVNIHEIKEGIVYKDDLVTVEAFLVEHGNLPEAYGYKFTTPDRTIAVSGDTRPSKNLIEKCRDVDILIHEVYSFEKLKVRSEFWQSYHKQFHTSTIELAEIANRLQPRLLILYHQLYWGATDADLIKEISSIYQGKVVSAQDLDIY